MKLSNFQPVSRISCENGDVIYTATVVIKKLFRKPVKRRIARFEDSEWSFVDGPGAIDLDALRALEIQFLLDGQAA